MHYHVLTLFPDMIETGLNTSIIGRAMDKGILTLETIDIRDFSEDKHKRVDDYPYSGGAGMVMNPGPVYRAYRHVVDHMTLSPNNHNANQAIPADEVVPVDDAIPVDEVVPVGDANSVDEPVPADEAIPVNEAVQKRPRVIYLTPQGQVFQQGLAEELAKEEDLIFLCGHYEGIDERVLEMIVTDYVSIGDYVLTGGELPAMVMIDTISRLVPGVLNNHISAEFESLHDNLLEYPQYTRPEDFMGEKVPEVLLSGHHANIETWRRKQSIIRTAKNRPDLLAKATLSKKELAFLEEYLGNEDKIKFEKDL